MPWRHGSCSTARAPSASSSSTKDACAGRAGVEVVVSQGAIQTPKLLMQSGIGPHEELSRFGIAVRQHLPGVGSNLHDHVSLNLVFEGTGAPLPVEVRSAMVAFWKTTPALDAPNFDTYAIGVPFLTPENAAKYPSPQSAWTFVMGMRPASRGTVRLTGAKASDPLLIHINDLAEPEDLGNLVLGVERAREIGNAAPLRGFTKGELAAGKLSGAALEDYIRNGLGTFWHQSCTAKMGRDETSVVDSKLKVHGIEGLRIEDAAVLPRVTTGNTMAPCVIVGEMAAAMLQDQYRV